MTDLIDLEARLRAGLDAEASGAPAVGGLAAAARRRHRIRRGKRAWTGALAMVLLVPVMLVGLVRATTHVEDDPGQRPDAGSATRMVTWNGVAVTVPTDWPDGLTSRWCGGDEPIETSAAVVTTPDVPAPPVDYECNPGRGYGVELGTKADLAAAVLTAQREGGASGPYRSPREIAARGVWHYNARDRDAAAFPEDSWVQLVATTDGAALVVTREQALTERIAATVHRLDPPAAGWRTVRWPHGRLDVPEGWRVGSPVGWCADGRPEPTTPRIQLPNQPVLDIACNPRMTYGVAVIRGGQPSMATPGGPAVQYVEPRHRHPLAPYPDRSWVASARVGAWSVVVVAADRRTAETVAASARAG